MKRLSTVLSLCLLTMIAFGQDINAGLDAATAKVKGTQTSVFGLIMAIAAVVAVVGAVRVYNLWQQGDPHVSKHVMGWIGSCAFIVMVGFIIRAIFG